MKDLVDILCDRMNGLREKINFMGANISNETSKKINASINSVKKEHYYSAASFCYSANRELYLLILEQQNITEEKLNLKIEKLKKYLDNYSSKINSEKFRNTSIQTLNDYHIYITLQSRVFEAREYLNFSGLTNFSQKINSYASSFERNFTLYLWESQIKHQGKNVSVSGKKEQEACENIARENQLHIVMLQEYGQHIYFANDYSKFLKAQESKNYPLCIYNGLNLKGRMSFALHTQQADINSSLEILEFAKKQILLKKFSNTTDILPTIYTQYASNLRDEEEYLSSQLYSYTALSYVDLDNYIVEQTLDTVSYSTFMGTYFKKIILGVILLFLIIFVFL